MSRRSRQRQQRIANRLAPPAYESRAARPSAAGLTGPGLPAGASYRPISPQQLAAYQQQQQQVYRPALSPQYDAPRKGGALYGDNSSPVSAYQSTPDPQTTSGAGMFPPGDPIRPTPGLGIRQWQYPVGSNITPTPRQTEAISFEMLRNLAASYYGIGLCEATYFRILQRLELEVVPDQRQLGEDENITSDKWRTPGRRMADWFAEGPDKRGGDLKAWMIAVERDLLELDACGIFPEPTRSGTLYALSYVDGATIKCLEDLSGRTPRPPEPAYQQILYGAPGRVYQRATRRVTGDQIDYLKLVTRTDSLYGQPPLERMILTVNQALRKQSYDLSRYTRGSTPEGVIETTEPELLKLSADQVKLYEDAWNAVLSGNDALRATSRFVQPGFHFTSTRQQEIATEFDEFLLKIGLAMFGLTRDEVGWTDTSNRATGSAQENVTYRNAVKPSAQYFASYFTSIIKRYDGQPLSVVDATISVPGRPTTSKAGTWDARYIAKWGGIEEPDDWNRKASSVGMLVDKGVLGRTQAKRLLNIPIEPGEQPIPAMITTPGGTQSLVVLEDVLKNRDKMADAHSATLDASIASSKQVKTAMEQQQEMAAQGGGAPMNPVALQAMAAGKPEAAQQAASGGVHPAQQSQQGQQTQQQQQKPTSQQQSTAQKAAAQQVGAKLASAASKRGEGIDNDDADRVPDHPQWDTYAVTDSRTGAGVGWDVADERYDALGAGENDRGDSESGTASRAIGGGAAGGLPLYNADWRSHGARSGATGGATGVQYHADTVDGIGGALDSDPRRGSGGDMAASLRQRGSTGQSDPRDDAGRVGGAQGSGRSAGREPVSEHRVGRSTDSERIKQVTTSTPEDAREARSEDWRRWRERSLKAVKNGRNLPVAFTSRHIPETLYRSVSERLARATTSDEVRAVFTEAREMEERGTAASKKTKADDDDLHKTGVMVAFFVPREVAQQIAVPGGEKPEEHHITLAYLGKKDDYTPAQLRSLRKEVANFAADEQIPHPATLTGVKRFPTNAEEGTYPVYAAVDAPKLEQWRERLMKRLEAAGFAPSRQFADYVPHITLAYVPDGEPLPADDVPHASFPLDTVTLAVGGEHFPSRVGSEQFPDYWEHKERGAKGGSEQRVADDPLQRLADALVARLELSSTAATQATLRELRAEVLDRL